MTRQDGKGCSEPQDLTQQLAAIRAKYDVARQAMHDALEQMLDEIRARYDAETRRLRGDGLMHPEIPSAPGSFKAARGCLPYDPTAPTPEARLRSDAVEMCLPLAPMGPRRVEVLAEDLLVYGQRIAGCVRGDLDEDPLELLMEIEEWLERLYHARPSVGERR